MNDLGRHLEGRTRRTQDRQEGEGDGETKCKVGLFCFVKTFQRGMPLTPIRCTEIWTSGSEKHITFLALVPNTPQITRYT